MENETNLERKIEEIRIGVTKIETKLDDLKELSHEQRIKSLEEWKARQTGYRSGIQYLINLAIGILGILIGSKLF